MSEDAPPLAPETVEIRRVDLLQLLQRAAAVVEHVNRNEAQEGGLLGRDTLRQVGTLRLELGRWRVS